MVWIRLIPKLVRNIYCTSMFQILLLGVYHFGTVCQSGRWTTDEHNLFLTGLKMYQKQWKQIAELVKTRTVVQIRTHAQKYFQKLEKIKDSKGNKKFPGSIEIAPLVSAQRFNRVDIPTKGFF